MVKGSFENALRDIAQRENRVTIAAADGFWTDGRIHEVLDDYLVLRTGGRKDHDVLFPLDRITWISIRKLSK